MSGALRRWLGHWILPGAATAGEPAGAWGPPGELQGFPGGSPPHAPVQASTGGTPPQTLSRISQCPCQWLRSLGETPFFLTGQYTHTRGQRLSPTASVIAPLMLPPQGSLSLAGVVMDHQQEIPQPLEKVHSHTPSNLRLGWGPEHQVHWCPELLPECEG